MANEQNLITQRDRSPEERRKVAQMGQKASAEARRRKKSIREVLEVILSLDAPEEMLQAGQELTKKMRRDAKSRGEAVTYTAP